MPTMWKGPNAELRAAHGDALWTAIHRRNGRLGINCNTAMDGRRAVVFTIQKGRDGEWYRSDLGDVEGDTPLSVALKVAHEFTPYDAELVAMHHEYIERLADDVEFETRDFVKRIDGVTNDLQDALSLVGA